MLDTFGREIRYLRLSVTDRCNLRCRYCMPEEGICIKSHAEMLTEEETVTAVRAAAALGVRKLRLTGGEPLVKKNILSIAARCAATEGIEEVCVTTNGTLLPPMAEKLKAAGVRRLNISLDTLDPQKYAYITRGGKLGEALLGIEAALQAGFEKIKINTVLIGGFNDAEIPALANLTKEYPVDVRFIELMPMTEKDIFGVEAYISCETVLAALPGLMSEEKQGGVAELYRLPGAMGRVGLIRPLSHAFCGECDRIRLTADGKLKPCLHSGAEYSVKGLDYAGMLSVMKTAILAKPARHEPLSFTERSGAGRDMHRIGG